MEGRWANPERCWGSEAQNVPAHGESATRLLSPLVVPPPRFDNFKGCGSGATSLSLIVSTIKHQGGTCDDGSAEMGSAQRQMSTKCWGPGQLLERFSAGLPQPDVPECGWPMGRTRLCRWCTVGSSVKYDMWTAQHAPTRLWWPAMSGSNRALIT